MIRRENVFNLGFDETDGLTESPDVDAARVALREAETGATRTEEAIAASREYLQTVSGIYRANHFTQKIRSIIQSPRSA